MCSSASHCAAAATRLQHHCTAATARLPLHDYNYLFPLQKYVDFRKNIYPNGHLDSLSSTSTHEHTLSLVLYTKPVHTCLTLAALTSAIPSNHSCRLPRLHPITSSRRQTPYVKHVFTRSNASSTFWCVCCSWHRCRSTLPRVPYLYMHSFLALSRLSG